MNELFHPYSIFKLDQQQRLQYLNNILASTARIAAAHPPQQAQNPVPLEQNPGTGLIQVARHRNPGRTYSGVATFKLQQEPEIFIDLSQTGYRFSGICFVNETKTLFTLTDHGEPDVVRTRSTVKIHNRRPDNFPTAVIPDLRRTLARNIDADGIRAELIKNKESRSHNTILIHWTFSSTS